jgi:trimeric autotransporter adhesin
LHIHASVDLLIVPNYIFLLWKKVQIFQQEYRRAKFCTENFTHLINRTSSSGGFMRVFSPQSFRLVSGRNILKTSAIIFAFMFLIHFSTNLRAQTVGDIYTYAGTNSGGYDSGDGGPATSATLSNPTPIVFDSQGNLYIGDTDNYRIRKVTPEGIISTIAGNGRPCYGYPPTQGVQATSTCIDGANALAVDAAGNIYVSFYYNLYVAVINTSGIISTFAGNGGYNSGDGGPATAAGVGQVNGLVTDSSGNVYMSTSQGSIRVVNPDGIISTYSVYSFAGGGMVFDSAHNLYVACDEEVIKITPQGSISVIVGNGTSGNGGDGGPATQAQIGGVFSIAMDANGNLLLPDTLYGRVRIVSMTTGIINEFAGTGENDGGVNYNGDGIPATSANINHPNGVAVDSKGNVYIASTWNERVQYVFE